MQEKLLTKFPAVDKDTWKEKIITDLKGKSYDTLLWSNHGLSGEPIYAAEDLEDLGDYRAFQNNNISSSTEVNGYRHWTNYQLISVSDEKSANDKALEALSLGADGLVFQISNIVNLGQLLNGIELQYCHVAFEGLNKKNPIVSEYISYIKSQGIEPSLVNGFISTEETHVPNSDIKGLKLNSISSHSGFGDINVIQELALLLHQASLVLSTSDSPQKMFSTFQFQLRMGKHYFIEIAKVRALRILASTLGKGFGLAVEPDEVSILSASDSWDHPTEDVHDYLLEATTSAMSAIIGGCNGLLIRPFNTTFKENPALASRNARNISSILKDEAYLDKVVDPSAGSYYIESLTNQIVEESWSLFLRLEKLSSDGSITPEILESANLKSDSL